MAYRAPFGARSTTTGCGRSSASNQGGGVAGEWPESDRRRVLAAAGVRAGAGTRLQRSSEQTEWRGILLEAPGACQCPWCEQERLGNAGLPTMADGGLG